MIQSRTIITFTLFALLLCLFNSQDIVDFSYSHYLQEGSSGTANAKKIDNIHPSESTFEKYQFPTACSIANKLNSSAVDSIGQREGGDLDTVLTELKDDFVLILQVSQKIKNAKKKIKELGQLAISSSKTTSVAPQQLDLLKKFESRLQQINDQIKKNTEELDDYMNKAMSGSQNNQYTQANMNFQIESLQIKLKYLKSIKLGQSPQQASDFNGYFKQLKDKFKDQLDLVQDLNSILKNYNDLAEKQAEIENKRSRISAHQLLIEDKMNCKKDIDDIRKNQKDNEKIKQLMKNLREKKKQAEGITNQYCQGVAKKLQQQVKKLLKVYNYAFVCADGLNDLIAQKEKDQKELEQLQKILNDLKAKKGLNDYKKKFDVNRQFMEKKIRQIDAFKLQKYHHKPEEIDSLIRETEDALQKAQQNKNKIASNKDGVAFDYKKTQEYVNKIKKLKGNYCRQHQLYENKAKQLKMQVIRYRQDVNYSIKMQNLYSQQINNLRGLQRAFEQLRKKIVEKMEDKSSNAEEEIKTTQS